jgi:hypothetical protein
MPCSYGQNLFHNAENPRLKAKNRRHDAGGLGKTEIIAQARSSSQERR